MGRRQKHLREKLLHIVVKPLEKLSVTLGIVAPKEPAAAKPAKQSFLKKLRVPVKPKAK